MTTKSFRRVRALRFGEFELDLRAGELRRDGQKLRLQEQPYRILTMLLEHPGDVVLREEICKRLWPNGTIVEVSHGINAAVLRLREALGDSAVQPRFVETVARRGYRFLVPVETEYSRQSSGSSELPPSEFQQDRLSEGQTFSHFRLEERLGRGGMGVVYRAQDLNLSRPVALKFLAPEMAGDPGAVGRFLREARTASALNHPNICTVYAVEECAGQPVIVMELLEGRTLESMLSDGPLPVGQALTLSIQMAAALDTAQRNGIVHRDLKPGNVMVTQFGVKVLDFGLAKQSVTGRPPALSGVTQAGSILGTPNYMAPELFEGQEADARSDLYAFGLMLFEMLTGVPAATRPLKELPAVAAHLEPVVRRALESNPQDRWQTAGDLKAALECAAAARVSPAPIAMVSPADQEERPVRQIRAFQWTGRKSAAAAILALGVLAWWFGLSAQRFRLILLSPSPPVARLADARVSPSVPENLPDKPIKPEPPLVNTADLRTQRAATAVAFRSLPTDPPVSGRLTLSPDGQFLAYASAGEIYVRTIDGKDTRLVAAKGGMAGTPFWSPDGRSLAFTSAGSLFTVPARGGVPTPVGQINTALAGAWGPDGTILIGAIGGGLVAIPSAGGPDRRITIPDKSAGEGRHLLPQFLPGGRNFLYTAGSDKPGGGTLYAGSLDSTTRVPIMPIESGATFVPRKGSKGYLVFDRASYLMVQPFDAAAFRTEGEAVRIAGPIRGTVAATANAITIPEISATRSTLVYRSAPRPRTDALMNIASRGAMPAPRDAPNVIVLKDWMAGLSSPVK